MDSDSSCHSAINLKTAFSSEIDLFSIVRRECQWKSASLTSISFIFLLNSKGNDIFLVKFHDENGGIFKYSVTCLLSFFFKRAYTVFLLIIQCCWYSRTKWSFYRIRNFQMAYLKVTRSPLPVIHVFIRGYSYLVLQPLSNYKTSSTMSWVGETTSTVERSDCTQQLNPILLILRLTKRKYRITCRCKN